MPGGLPPEPLHGFHGRGSELLRLERLFRDHAVVVLHGYGGQGKTALAAEAGRWLHRAGRFPGGAAFIPFERGAGPTWRSRGRGRRCWAMISPRPRRWPRRWPSGPAW